jgi:hypothetical protein
VLQAGFEIPRKLTNEEDGNINNINLPGESRVYNRDREYFIAIEGRKLEDVPEGRVFRNYFYATGNVNEFFKSRGLHVDRFYVSAGLANFDQRLALRGDPSVRAFGRLAGLPAGAGVLETGLIRVHGKDASADDAAGVFSPSENFMHADLALAGEGEAQRSTISLTLGEAGDDAFETQGLTVGSGRLTPGSALAFGGPLVATAVGGGNPAFTRPGDPGTKDPRAGYYVLESPPQIVSSTSRIRSTRSGWWAGTAGGPLRAPAPRHGRRGRRHGHARRAHLVRDRGLLGGLGRGPAPGRGARDRAAGGQQRRRPGQHAHSRQRGGNRVQADLKLTSLSTRNDQVALQLGQLEDFGPGRDASVLVSDDVFAAQTFDSGNFPEPDRRAALLTAKNVEVDFKNALPDLPDLPALEATDGVTLPALAAGGKIDDYEHVKWGFFFGDMLDGSGQPTHVHLGTWTAGKVPDGSSLGLKGHATYEGHAVGNVFNGATTYTATGRFRNDWDFDERRGKMQLNFDQTLYNGTTKLTGKTYNLKGDFSNVDRAGALRGSFVHGGALAKGEHPSEALGRFSIARSPARRSTGPQARSVPRRCGPSGSATVHGRPR